MRVIYPFPKTASIIEVFTKIHPHCDGKQIAYLTSRPDLERQLVLIYSAWATIWYAPFQFRRNGCANSYFEKRQCKGHTNAIRPSLVWSSKSYSHLNSTFCHYLITIAINGADRCDGSDNVQRGGRPRLMGIYLFAPKGQLLLGRRHGAADHHRFAKW